MKKKRGSNKLGCSMQPDREAMMQTSEAGSTINLHWGKKPPSSQGIWLKHNHGSPYSGWQRFSHPPVQLIIRLYEVPLISIICRKWARCWFYKRTLCQGHCPPHTRAEATNPAISITAGWARCTQKSASGNMPIRKEIPPFLQICSAQILNIFKKNSEHSIHFSESIKGQHC